MKIIKVFLTLLTLAIVILFAKNLMSDNGEPFDDVDGPPFETNHKEYIEKKIESLGAKPDSIFHQALYNDIVGEITNLGKKNKLGESPSENKNNKDMFLNDVFTVYANKFIQTSFTVFEESVWEQNDIDLIREESQKLSNSEFLPNPSRIYDNLSSLQTIINKYDEVTYFISNSRKIKLNPNPYLLDYTFPFNTLKNKIFKVENYKNNKLGNSYVNNNLQLHRKISRIKKQLIKQYTDYVYNKINYHMGSYQEVPKKMGWNYYDNKIHSKLSLVYDTFKNNCQNNDYEYDSSVIINVKAKLDNEVAEAYTYFIEIIN
jgi:hypothetical protein